MSVFVTINVPLFLEVRDFMFFRRGKHIRFAQDNLNVKKVLAPSKNPAKWLIMCFSQLKSIKFQTFKISGTLVFLCTSEQGLHLRMPNPGLTQGSPPPLDT
jgi:hypothetical protein